MNPQQPSDQELLDRYRTGDMSALGTLYTRYATLVFGVCMKYLKDRHLSEDAMMAIYEELISKLKQHEIASFKSWLHIVAKHHCLQILRKKKVHFEQPDDPRIMHLSSEMHQEDMEVLERKESKLRGCVSQLGDDQRLVIELFYFKGMTYKGIAERAEIDTETVRSRIQNGRRNLRNCMEQFKELG